MYFWNVEYVLHSLQAKLGKDPLWSPIFKCRICIYNTMLSHVLISENVFFTFLLLLIFLLKFCSFLLCACLNEQHLICRFLKMILRYGIKMYFVFRYIFHFVKLYHIISVYFLLYCQIYLMNPITLIFLIFVLK